MNEPLVNSLRTPTLASLGGRLIVCDGVNANLVTDGAEMRLLGIRPPTTDFTAVAAATGIVTAGVHLVAVTFAILKGGQIFLESNIKTIVSVTIAANQKISLAALPVSDSDAIGARVVYMSKAGAATLYRVGTGATITDNSTTTYSLNIADATLTAIELSYANEFIPAKPFVMESAGRLLFWGDVPYKTGNVDVLLNSTALTFHDANLNRVHVGRRFVVAGTNLAYVIKSVTRTSATASTAVLETAYLGANANAQEYIIIGNAQDLILANPLPNNIEGYDIASDVTAIFPVTGDDNDPPTGMMALRDMRILSTHQRLRALLGDPATGALVDIVGERGPLGLAGHNAYAQVPEGPLMFYTGTAVYGLDANVPRELSKDIRSLLTDNVNHSLDDRTHAVWYGARSLFMLWTAALNSTKVIDQCFVADCSDYPRLVSWWRFTLAAASSRIIPVNGIDRVVIGDYWGNLRVWDTGDTDGVARVTQSGTLTAVGPGELTDNQATFIEDDTPTLAGVVITITSGNAAGQSRYIASNDNVRLLIDLRAGFGGAFTPYPVVGDTYELGVIPAYWQPPDLTTEDGAEIKRWEYATTTTEARSANNRLDLTHAVNAHGAFQPRLRIGARLRPQLHNHHVTRLTGRATDLRLRYQTTHVNQPWRVTDLTVVAAKGRGLR